MTTKPETATVSHRFIDLRARTAKCTCGETYTTTTAVREEATAELRAQHKAHKASPTPAKKAPARKPATKAAPVAAKPRPRRAAKATAA